MHVVGLWREAKEPRGTKSRRDKGRTCKVHAATPGRGGGGRSRDLLTVGRRCARRVAVEHIEAAVWQNILSAALLSPPQKQNYQASATEAGLLPESTWLEIMNLGLDVFWGASVTSELLHFILCVVFSLLRLQVTCLTERLVVKMTKCCFE